jgi:signal transduction histidine kinase
MGLRESTGRHRIRDNRRGHRRARRHVATALVVIAAAALIGNDAFNAGLAIVNARRVTKADAWVIRSHEVREALQQLQRVLYETESRQRGFLMTGEQRYLERYQADRAAVEHHLSSVVDLTADNSAQQQHVHALRPLIATRLDLLDRGVQLRNSGASRAAIIAATRDEGERLMDAIGAEVREMVAVEDELLRGRVRSSTVAGRNAVVTSVLGLAASVAVVFGVIWLLDRRAREVARARRMLRSVVRALPDPVVVVRDQQVTGTNAAADELFRKAGRAPPTTVDELVALATPSSRFRDALIGRQPLVGLDAALRVEVAGDTRRILPRAVPIAGDDESSGVIVVLSDVTDLARLDEMRSDLVAAASHELRTPMTTLRMTLLMLREGAGDLAPRMRELVETALVGVKQLLDTVDELLDMTRIEAGRLRLFPEPLYLGDVAREVVDRAATRAEELGLRLRVHAPDGEQAVLGDRARLRIVVDNLVSNALKYTPRGGAVELGVSSRRDGASGAARKVELAVTDTGRGVPEEFRSRVFEKFFRVEHYRPCGEDEPRGAGVGLYLCKEIVELHGGTIRCEPAPNRRGTRLVVALPMAEGTLPARDATLPAAEAPPAAAETSAR